jgi:hypothetical protein
VVEHGQEQEEHPCVQLALAEVRRIALVLDHLCDAQYERVERQLRELRDLPRGHHAAHLGALEVRKVVKQLLALGEGDCEAGGH